MTKTQRALVAEVMNGPEYFVALILLVLPKLSAELVEKLGKACLDQHLKMCPHLCTRCGDGFATWEELLEHHAEQLESEPWEGERRH